MAGLVSDSDESDADDSKCSDDEYSSELSEAEVAVEDDCAGELVNIQDV